MFQLTHSNTWYTHSSAACSCIHKSCPQCRITRAEFAALMHGLNASILDASAFPPVDSIDRESSGWKSDPVIIVGAGPAGLFAALSLASRGIFVKVLERGKAVEDRGKDIGALMVRRKLNPESNFCFGEGGAGTWSDGKLTTKVGRNGAAVRAVSSAPFNLPIFEALPRPSWCHTLLDCTAVSKLA
jgi:uncharacterized FAD-dependent dehydrogenase